MKKITLSLFFLVLVSVFKSQTPTMGLITYGNGDYPGYVLFNPSSYTHTYLIDKCGYKIREWQSNYAAGHAAYLLPDGSLLRAGNAGNNTFNAGGKGGMIEKWDFNGNLTWSFQVSSTTECQHHDICALPNGNVLALVWEKKTISGAVAQGRNPSLLGANIWEEKIVEYQPTGLNSANAVWEWHAWNHLVQDYDSTKPNYGVVADHPELFNFNYVNGVANADWMHMNGIAYDAAHDQIIISSRALCEIYVIDHSTNAAQAASHSGGNYGKGGDVLYRYGNPMAYNRGVLADRKFYFQHCPRWIPTGHPWAGKISVFNNGNGRPQGSISTVDVIEPPVDANWNYSIGATLPYGPDSLYWSYSDPVPTNLFSSTISGAFSMPNGSFMVTDGQAGEFFEIDTLKNKRWLYKNPVNANGPQTQGTTFIGPTVFKATFYDLSYSAFNGQTLTPGLPIELNPYSYTCNMTTLGVPEEQITEQELLVYPVPANDRVFIEQISETPRVITLFSCEGKALVNFSTVSVLSKIDLSAYESGIYFLQISGEGNTLTKKIVIEN